MFVDTSQREFWSFHKSHKSGQGLIFPRAMSLTSLASRQSMSTNGRTLYYRGLIALLLICLEFDLNIGDMCQVGRELRLPFKKLALLHTQTKYLPPDSSLPDVSLEFHSKLQKVTWGKKLGGLDVLSGNFGSIQLGWALHSLINWNPPVKSCSKVTDSNFSLF